MTSSEKSVLFIPLTLAPSTGSGQALFPSERGNFRENDTDHTRRHSGRATEARFKSRVIAPMCSYVKKLC